MRLSLNRLFLALFVTLAIGCTSTKRDLITTGKPFGDFGPLNDYIVEVDVDEDRVSGKSKGGTYFFGLFSFGDTDYADETRVLAPDNLDSGHKVGLSDLFGSRVKELKSAAVRDACDTAKCDVLAYPMYTITYNEGFFSDSYTVEVRGFPGHVKTVYTVPRDEPAARVKAAADAAADTKTRQRASGSDFRRF